jgi:hypothetical protein
MREGQRNEANERPNGGKKMRQKWRRMKKKCSIYPFLSEIRDIMKKFQ